MTPWHLLRNFNYTTLVDYVENGFTMLVINEDRYHPIILASGGDITEIPMYPDRLVNYFVCFISNSNIKDTPTEKRFPYVVTPEKIRGYPPRYSYVLLQGNKEWINSSVHRHKVLNDKPKLVLPFPVPYIEECLQRELLSEQGTRT